MFFSFLFKLIAGKHFYRDVMDNDFFFFYNIKKLMYHQAIFVRKTVARATFKQKKRGGRKREKYHM